LTNASFSSLSYHPRVTPSGPPPPQFAIGTRVGGVPLEEILTERYWRALAEGCGVRCCDEHTAARSIVICVSGFARSEEDAAFMAPWGVTD
jgi:hypothetical protein